jgi:hypothetical protein
MPDCRNCQRPMRWLCDALSEYVGNEYRMLALAPPQDRAHWLAEIEVSDRAQEQLQRVCARKQREERSSPHDTPPGADLTSVVQISAFIGRRYPAPPSRSGARDQERGAALRSRPLQRRLDLSNEIQLDAY